jgi:hypothetical protein
MGRERRRGTLGTVCAGGAALRRASGSARHRLCPHGPPAPVLATAASRCRREGLSGIHSGRPIPAHCSLAATSDAPRDQKRLALHGAHGDSGLVCSIPGARSLLRSSALGCCGTCSRAMHRVLLRAAAAAQVRDQLSLAPPPRAAPRQSPPPDAPRSPRSARAPPARARASHPEPRTPFPVASPIVTLTPAGSPDGKVPALAADAMTLAAMAASGIPQGAGGRQGGKKRALGACPSCSCVFVISQRSGIQPQPPACSEPRPEAATLSGSRKAHRLGEAAPSVGFKRPLSAPGVAERFLRSLLATAAILRLHLPQVCGPTCAPPTLQPRLPLILETSGPESKTPWRSLGT